MRRLLEQFETVVVLDLETTGLSFRQDQVIELGAVRWDGGEVTEGSPETEEPADGADGSAADTPPLYILQAAP